MKLAADDHQIRSASSTPRASEALLWTVYFIYFFCGLTQCFESVFLPEFKQYFGLNYQGQMYIMFAKNIPFVLAPLLGYLIRYTGYKNCMTLAMALFAGGTILLIPGLQTQLYSVVLAGFFLIGLGFNCEIVAGNPMLSALGPKRGGSSRLNLGNALGAVAQIIAPATISVLIPAAAISIGSKIGYIQKLFLVLGLVLAGVSLLTIFLRNVDIELSFEADTREPGSFWKSPRVMLGFLAIFLVLGVEAAQFGLYRNFLEDPAIAALTPPQSQRMFAVFLLLFALGRLAASWIQRRVSPVLHLLLTLGGAVVCLSLVIFTTGTVAVFAMTLIGFLVSIFYPTLYSLAIDGMGQQTGYVSGFLTMGFLGCALIPVLQGWLADAVGLQRSFALGFLAYVFAAFYAFRLRRMQVGNE